MRDTKQSGVLRGLRGTGLGRAHKVTTPGTVRTTFILVKNRFTYHVVGRMYVEFTVYQ